MESGREPCTYTLYCTGMPFCYPSNAFFCQRESSLRTRNNSRKFSLKKILISTFKLVFRNGLTFFNGPNTESLMKITHQKKSKSIVIQYSTKTHSQLQCMISSKTGLTGPWTTIAQQIFFIKWNPTTLQITCWSAIFRGRSSHTFALIFNSGSWTPWGKHWRRLGITGSTVGRRLRVSSKRKK